MSKICNRCGNEVDDNVKFCPYCKGQTFRPKQEVATPNDTMIHKVFYWNYDNRYVLSKSKITTIGVFIMFSVFALISGAPIGILFFAVIFSALMFMFCFALHKIAGPPSPEKLKHNDYGLVQDFINLLFFWQNREGGYALSKTKIISHLIFLAFFGIGLFMPMTNLFISIMFGLIFEVPAFVLGYGIHKLTNPNPQAKPKEIKPKKEKPLPKVTPKVEIPKKQAISEYIDYQFRLDELNSKFRTKEKSTRNLIEKRFEPPQLTYTRFIGVVDKSSELFKKHSDSAYTMIELADEYSPRIAKEIEGKIGILESIIDKMDGLSNELIISNDLLKQDDVDDLIGQMDDLIKSVKDYE